MDPNETVRTREITVTSENIKEVAHDIMMDPKELAELYMTYKLANTPLIIVMKEPDND